MPTIRAERPEVVAAVLDRINAPINFIGRRFFPVIPIADKTGVLYYMSLVADALAEVRSDQYATVTAGTMGEDSANFTATEKVKSYSIPEAREKGYGGIDAADRIGVTAACRSVRRKHETDASAKVITAARYNAGTYLTDGQVLRGMQTVALSVGRYYGKTVLAGSTTFFQNFVMASDVSAKIASLVGNGFDPKKFADAVEGQPSVALAILRAFLPFDEVLVGDDAFWALSGKTDAGIIARLPSVEDAADPERMEMAMRENAVYGVGPWYLPDPASREILFQCRSYFDDSNDCNIYKAKGFFDLLELNASAAKIVKFTPPAVSTTTTSTTTTTTAG
jgi:hypothetical protein